MLLRILNDSATSDSLNGKRNVSSFDPKLLIKNLSRQRPSLHLETAFDRAGSPKEHSIGQQYPYPSTALQCSEANQQLHQLQQVTSLVLF